MTEFIAVLIILSAIAWLLIDARGSWIIKAMFIYILIMTSLAIFGKISQYKGSPREVDSLPVEFVHVASVVDEPNGTIYLWMKELDSKELFPLSVKFPYNRDIHKAAEEGKQASQGQPFKMTLEKAEGSEGESDGSEGNNENKADKSVRDKSGGSISLESIGGASAGIVPPSMLPRKDQ